ncbi:MAG: hypothetical protein ABI432_04250 [Flavobacteriales bacterium]
MRAHACLLVLPLLGFVPSKAQTVAIDTISAVQPWAPNEAYSFPHLRMPEQPDIAARIHHDLCTDFLQVDPDSAGNDIFEMVWGDAVSGGMPRLNSLTWSFTRPLPQLLGFEFSAEGCGAYCEGFTTHYVYDLRNGDRLVYDSLFTAAGLIAVNDTLDRAWRRVVSDRIQMLDDERLSSDLAPEDAERINSKIELYRVCFDERPVGEPYVADMEPLSNGMRVFIARCSAHANRELDELDAVELFLPYSWLVPYLRPDVRVVFGL